MPLLMREEPLERRRDRPAPRVGGEELLEVADRAVHLPVRLPRDVGRLFEERGSARARTDRGEHAIVEPQELLATVAHRELE